MYYGERFNAITHLVGAFAAVAGSIALIIQAAHSGDPWKIVSVLVFGSTLVVMYCASALYHSLRGRAKAIFMKLDHLSIYLLIAGTYTPFCLITLSGPWGWSLLAAVWGLALVGTLQELHTRSKARILSLVIYLVMGWAIVAALRPLLQTLGTEGFVWLAVGGLFYSGGIAFYALDQRLRHAHGIWHLFVLAGSTAHYITVLVYVI